MKKLMLVSSVTILLMVLLLAGCRPPEVEGVVINMNQELYDKAYELAKEAVQKYPENAEAWYLLGELHGRFDNYEEMNEAFTKSLALSPTYQSDIEQQRMRHFAENYNKALKNYYNPAMEETDSLKRRELYEQAAKSFLNSHQAMPNRIEPLTPMSVSFLEIGDTAKAEKYVMKAVELNPQNDTLMVRVGDFFYRSNQPDKALDMYNKALAVNENSTEAILAIGEIYSKQEKWTEALDYFKRAEQRQPKNPAIPNNIAIILYNEGKYEEAIPFTKKTVELEPQNKSAYELLSLSYMQAAQKYLDKFNETEDPAYQQTASEFFTEALPILEDATQKFPDSSLLWNNLGVCYAQKGMKDKAEKAFEMQKKLEESQ